MISYPPGSAWRRGPHNNYENATEQALADWALRNGKLQKVLQRNEYKILEDSPIFESNFLQVTKNGEYVGIYNHPSIVTVGVLATRPSLLLPDLMIIARVKRGFPENKVPRAEDLEITRLIPLHLVEIFLHDVNDRRLKVQMVTGRTYYLKLCAPERVENFLFERWMRLIYLLHVDRGRISTPGSFTSKDSGLYTIWKSESLQAMSRRHWIPTIMDMDKEAKEHLREKLQYAYANRNKPRENDTASKNTLNPGFTHYAGPPGISTKEGDAFREQPRSPKLAATNKSVVRNSQKYKVKPTTPKHSRSKKQARSKTASPRSSPKSRVSTGAQKSTSAPKSRVMEADKPMKRMPSAESDPVPIKLQRSKKNTSLIQNTDTALKAEGSILSTQSPDIHPGPAELQTLSSQGAGESPASSLTAEKQSHPTTRPPASPNLKPHISGAGRPSEAHDLLVAAGPSSAATPPRPASMGPQTSLVKHGTSVTPPKKDTSIPHKRISKVKPWEQKASSRRRPTSQRSSPEQKRSTTWSFIRKRKDSEVPLRRAMVSVAAGPSQPMWKDVAVGPSEVISNMPKGQPSKSKEKSKKLIQPSGATRKPDLPRSQASESKGKVKKALSSAKQRSSLTFVTIYSILSSSMEKLRTKSKDDIKEDAQEQKLSEGEEENVTAKLSKRVTISGVVGPSGKVMTEQETTTINKTIETADLCVQDKSTKALEQGKPGGQTQQQNKMDAAQKPKSQPSTPSGPPPSCVSIGLGYSITETRSVGIECSMVIVGSQEAGPSRLSNKAEEDSKMNKAFQPQRFELVEIKEKLRDKKMTKYRPSRKKISRRRQKAVASRSTPRPIPGVQRWAPRRPPDRLANGVPWPPRNWSHSSYPTVQKLRSQKLRSEMQSVSPAAAPELKPKKRDESYKTAPFDPRFPNANQTRNCFQNYMDYYRCVKIMTAKDKDVKSCEWYRRIFTSICPTSWINRWDEQRKAGIFPGKI